MSEHMKCSASPMVCITFTSIHLCADLTKPSAAGYVGRRAGKGTGVLVGTGAWVSRYWRWSSGQAGE
eukprot:5972268-Pleurochrysis_carterae.AAC.1